MLFQKVCLKVAIPVFKKCFGDDKKKMRPFAVPEGVLGLELAPCLLLLGSDMASLGFWGLKLFFIKS